MTPDFCFEPMATGSMPHIFGAPAAQLVINTIPTIPSWPQLPKRSFTENMVVPFSEGLPGRALSVTEELIWFDTRGDLSTELERFYQRYLNGDPGAFSMPSGYLHGWEAFCDLLPETPGDWVKGQLTGPVSMGLMITDQDGRPILYNDWLVDVLVKNAEMQARWQIRRLKALRSNVILTIDEPSLTLFGSSHISLSRDLVIAMLEPVIAAIHEEGAISCVHCCANTDWSLLLGSNIGIINLDAYGYLDGFSLYSQELQGFLDSGGSVCWGIVPNNAEIDTVSANNLASRLWRGIDMLVMRAERRGIEIQEDTLARRSMISTRCGLGATDLVHAERALRLLPEVAEILRARWPVFRRGT